MKYRPADSATGSGTIVYRVTWTPSKGFKIERVVKAKEKKPCLMK